MDTAPDSRLATALLLHQEVVSDLMARIERNIARQAELQAELGKIREERGQLEADRQALDVVEGLYRRRLGNPGAAVGQAVTTNLPLDSIESRLSLEAGSGQLRARVGDQRYLILNLIRSEGATIGAIAAQTNYSERRVREQIKSDFNSGFVIGCGPDKWILSPQGENLLTRFEIYRRREGKALPILQNDLADADQEYKDSTTEAGGVSDSAPRSESNDAEDAMR